MEDLVRAVKDYANAHYEENGWDVLVECHSDEEILAWIGSAKTVSQAIHNVQRLSCIREYDSVRKDIQGEIF